MSAAAPAVAWAAEGEAASPEEVRRQIDRLAASGRYQTELPETEPDPPDPPRDPIEPFDLGPAARILLLVILAAMVVYVLAALLGRRIAPARKGAVRAAARVRPDDAPRSPSAAELADAEAAALREAAAGRFTEAVHLLLLGAIGRLRERDARSTARSFTSREILARVFRGDDEGAARAALASLVLAVELTRFGGQGADQAGFERCLEAYRALRRILETRPTAPPAGAAVAAT